MSWTRCSLLTFILALFSRTLLSAQDATGSIRGTVLDSAGGRISQASIVLVSTATGLGFTTTSDAEGSFAFDLLQPGDYSARVVAPGMSPQVTPQLRRQRRRRHLDFHLAIAGVHETVSN
jgi:hypothetical protein